MKDILLDDITDDLRIENGDFVTGESEMQEVSHIIRSEQGMWKENPVIGVGLRKFLKQKPRAEEIKKRIKVHLQRDEKDYDQIIKKIKINEIDFS